MFILLDYFFLLFHTLLIVVNVLGWIPKSTRKIQLYVILATLFSWFVMGLFYGWGYCLLTDWHWDVLSALGERPTQNAYVQYLFDRLLGWQISRSLSDWLTIIGLLVGIIGAILVRLIPKLIKK